MNAAANGPEPLLEVTDLVVEYPAKGIGRKPFRALKGVSVDVRPGECVGLVGESGSGKTTLGRAVLGLAPVTEGSVKFKGREIGRLGRRERRSLSDQIQVVFQDPYTSLNPSLTIEQTLAEPLRVSNVSAADASKRVRTLLDQVGLPANAADRLPREFSGGQRQRIAIARALALEPELIVCDEPVSALDLSTQARVLDLFKDIQEATGVAYLFVSHDLAVVRHLSHRVAVMYHGEIVEYGDGDKVTSDPEHPYTQRLLMAAPVADPDRQAQRRADRARMLAAQREADLQAGVARSCGRGAPRHRRPGRSSGAFAARSSTTSSPLGFVPPLIEGPSHDRRHRHRPRRPDRAALAGREGLPPHRARLLVHGGDRAHRAAVDDALRRALWSARTGVVGAVAVA